jgi:hypothetical protein
MLTGTCLVLKCLKVFVGCRELRADPLILRGLWSELKRMICNESSGFRKGRLFLCLSLFVGSLPKYFVEVKEVDSRCCSAKDSCLFSFRVAREAVVEPAALCFF